MSLVVITGLLSVVITTAFLRGAITIVASSHFVPTTPLTIVVEVGFCHFSIVVLGVDLSIGRVLAFQVEPHGLDLPVLVRQFLLDFLH